MLRTALTVGAWLTVATSAPAQGTGRSLDLDTSIRFSGMGGASNAVFWGGDPNEWANPAMLGYHRGIRYAWGKTQLVPGLSDDVFFQTERFTFGAGGLGVMTSGDPGAAPGSVRLDYGPSEGRDENGNPTGTFFSHEDIRSWGVGASVSELVRTFAAMSDAGAPALTRFVDVAGGFAHKNVDIVLAPASSFGSASGTGLDWGVLARFTPVDIGRGPYAESAIPVRVDFGFGASVLSFNDERVTFINAAQASPLSRIYREGVAARVAVGVPASLRSALPDRVAWLWDSLDPLVSVGAASDWERITGGDVDRGYRVSRAGLEITVVNMVSIRMGHVTDRQGNIDGGTSGWGLGFQVGRFAGFRYDHATIPQARDSGLEDVERRGLTLFVDPLALLNR